MFKLGYSNAAKLLPQSVAASSSQGEYARPPLTGVIISAFDLFWGWDRLQDDNEEISCTDDMGVEVFDLVPDVSRDLRANINMAERKTE